MTRIDLGMPALATLIPIGILAGIGMLLVFRHTSDQAAVRRAKSLVAAHLLEFRLFMDEPWLVLRAQRDLVRANLHFMKLMLRPAAVLTVPMALLLVWMDAFYGHAPLPVGQPAIVTAEFKHMGDLPILKAPADIAVETPGVRVPAELQVSWRIRPLRATTATLTLAYADRSISKSVSAGTGLQYLSERRGSLAALFLHPTERPILDSEVGWIEVRYPGASILHLHWLIWFFAVSGIAALLLRRKFKAAF